VTFNQIHFLLLYYVPNGIGTTIVGKELLCKEIEDCGLFVKVKTIDFIKDILIRL
jgi:hypothetical protein